MKHTLLTFLFVGWLVALLLAPVTASHAADDAPAPPDYQTVVKAIFDTADTCKIKGYVVDGIVYDFNAFKTWKVARH